MLQKMYNLLYIYNFSQIKKNYKIMIRTISKAKKVLLTILNH